MISQELTRELQEIIREESGHDLDMQKTSEIGNSLVGLFDLLAKIKHQDD